MAVFQFDVRAIVFDLDGVLVDTMPAIHAVWAEWAIARGISPELVLASIHLTALELIRTLAPDVDPAEEAARIAARQAGVGYAVTRFEGSRELVGSLPADRWAIVTSARAELARRHLELAELPEPRVLITAEDTPRGKPHPSGYRLAAERLGVTPADCVAVEDSPSGVLAAVAAGMNVLGVTNTHGPSDLREAHAVISSLADLEVVLSPGQDLGGMGVRRKDRIEDSGDPA